MGNQILFYKISVFVKLIFTLRIQTLLKFGKYIDTIIKKRESENNQKSLEETKDEIQKSFKSLSKIMSVHNTISRDNSFLIQLQTDEQTSIASVETPTSELSSITVNRDGTSKVYLLIFEIKK